MPQPALNINMDAETNVESLNFRFDKNAKVMPIVWSFRSRSPRLPIPIPIPDITPLNPPLGPIPPMPPKIQELVGNAKYSPLQAIVIGPDQGGAIGRLRVRRRHARRPPLWPACCNRASLVGVRGAGPAFDGLHYVKQRHPQDQARRVQAKLLAGPQRPALDAPQVRLKPTMRP